MCNCLLNVEFLKNRKKNKRNQQGKHEIHIDCDTDLVDVKLFRISIEKL